MLKKMLHCDKSLFFFFICTPKIYINKINILFAKDIKSVLQCCVNTFCLNERIENHSAAARSFIYIMYSCHLLRSSSTKATLPIKNTGILFK